MGIITKHFTLTPPHEKIVRARHWNSRTKSKRDYTRQTSAWDELNQCTSKQTANLRSQETLSFKSLIHTSTCHRIVGMLLNEASETMKRSEKMVGNRRRFAALPDFLPRELEIGICSMTHHPCRLEFQLGQRSRKGSTTQVKMQIKLNLRIGNLNG